MRNRLKLNEKEVRDLEPIKTRDYQVFDSEITGSGIRVYRSGNKAFTLDYRINGRQRRYKLGAWPEWSTRKSSPGTPGSPETSIFSGPST